MKISSWVCDTIAVAALLSTCFAGTSFVVTNNDNRTGNSSTIYSLNTTTGVLTHLLDLPTGGDGLGGGYFDIVGVAAAVNGTTGCLFVYDMGSSDIASFEVNLVTFKFTKVGNFSNAAVTSGIFGGSLAVTPNGKFVYADYGISENIGAWAVNSNCSLTFIAAYQASAGADFYDAIKVTPNGKDVLVSAPDLQAVEQFSIDQSTGALTDVGYANFGTLSECLSPNFCDLGGIDITADSLEVIVANAFIDAASVSLLAAEITPTGLTHPTYLPLGSTGTLSPGNGIVPFLSAAAYKGKGPIYVGTLGDGAGHQPGVVTASFSEGGNVTAIASTPVNAGGFDALIAATGNLLIVSEIPNTLQVFKINADGTLTATAQGPVVNPNAGGAYSFFIYPNTR